MEGVENRKALATAQRPKESVHLYGRLSDETVSDLRRNYGGFNRVRLLNLTFELLFKQSLAFAL